MFGKKTIVSVETMLEKTKSVDMDKKQLESRDESVLWDHSGESDS